NGTTLSKEFEELIISLTKRDIMDDIIKALGLKKGYISSEDVVKQRKALKKGFGSAKVIREMRDAREKRILGY
ncbi:MAG: hypothetical protein KGH50_04940, partial [Candidatus Micrarchaeota archaeon]|nr:hypothetical protein [Candidatus Micrarchaeota archaeon]